VSVKMMLISQMLRCMQGPVRAQSRRSKLVTDVQIYYLAA
jgi:hypothetical protein